MWPHNIGPMMTYMALSGNPAGDQFDAINTEWFKIDEAGQLPGNPSIWHQQDLYIGSGDYLVRHEIIALHLGNEPGGAEFYPGCSQIRIASNNGTVVRPNPTVSLPGAYNDTDPGVFVPTIFDPVQNYQFPGPEISNVVTEVNVTASNLTDTMVISTAENPCPAILPRKISRVMRNIHIHT